MEAGGDPAQKAVLPLLWTDGTVFPMISSNQLKQYYEKDFQNFNISILGFTPCM